jgi:hypothetical protein
MLPRQITDRTTLGSGGIARALRTVGIQRAAGVGAASVRADRFLADVVCCGDSLVGYPSSACVMGRRTQFARRQVLKFDLHIDAVAIRRRATDNVAVARKRGHVGDALWVTGGNGCIVRGEDAGGLEGSGGKNCWSHDGTGQVRIGPKKPSRPLERDDLEEREVCWAVAARRCLAHRWKCNTTRMMIRVVIQMRAARRTRARRRRAVLGNDAAAKVASARTSLYGMPAAGKG